jgi:hypothetical protein
VQQQQFPQQQVLDSPFLPFGGVAPVHPQPYLDLFSSGQVQQQVLQPLGPQHLLDPHQVPQQMLQPWEQQAGQHQQHLQQLPQQSGQQLEQLQQQQQQQEQPGLGHEAAGEDFGDLCNLLDQVEQQYELDKQSQQQQGGSAAAAEAATVDMTSAPRPYEVVYDRERKKQTAKRGGSLYGGGAEEQVPGVLRWRSVSGDKRAGTSARPMVRRQQPQDRQMAPHAACIPVMQLAMPSPPYMQIPPQQIQQMHVQELGRGAPPPWALSWAAAVSQKHPNAQLPSWLVANGTDSSSDTPPWQQQQQQDIWQNSRAAVGRGYQAALQEFASRHGAADRQCDAGAGLTVRLQHRVGSYGSQQQQPSASARAAAMLQHASSMSGASGGITGGAAGTGGSRSSPEAYFRRHVPQIDPFWASATPDDVGLVGVTQMQPAPAAAAGSSEQQRQSCTMSVLLTNSQLGMVKGKMATLQVGCIM